MGSQARCRKPPQDCLPENPLEKQVYVLWKDMPTWMQEDRFIHSGYRRTSHSYRSCIASIGHLHNPSVNILSHLLAVPFLLSTVYDMQFLGVANPPFTSKDYTIFTLFFLGATCCFGLSAGFHTVQNHSLPVRALWVRLDYVGIIILTVTTFVTGEYYVFCCDETRMRTHFFIVSSMESARTE